MASVIRIKRSSVSGNPATLGAGELAYSALTDNGFNGGDRLYIGMGAETAGNAANHYVIGGKYFIDMLDHTPGTLTASSAIIVDSNSKINNLNVGNITITGSTNTVSSTDTNGNIVLTPNGTGKLVLNNPYINGTIDTLAEYIYDTVGGAVTQGNGITVTPSDGANTTTISINTAVTVDLNTVQTLTNKTLTSPAINGATIGATGATFNGSTSGTITVLAAAVAGTNSLTLPAATDTLVGRATTDTLTNKTINLANNTLTATSAQLATAISDETGTGVVVFSNTPTLVTPVLGVATATTINKVTVTTPATGSTLTIADGKTLTASNTLTFTGTDTSSVAFGTGGTVAYVANKLSVFAATTSAELAGVISDETGTGALVFASSPTLITPTLGAALATSITATSGNLALNAAAGNNSVSLTPTGSGTVDVANKRITSVAEPTQSSDAATKNYVDAVKTGLDVKDSVRTTTTANLTAVYSNGSSGVGATLTNSGTQAALTIDSIVLLVGERVLVKDQTAGLQNGFYVVTNAGSASTNWILTRSLDADQNTEITPGAFTFVEEGTVGANNGYVCTNTGSITIGTSPISFVQFSGAGSVIAGDGLTKSGNTLNVGGTAGRITISADAVDIASTYVGQATITTLGTIATGVWNGSVIGATYGGTGVNNGANTLTLAGNVSHLGAFTQSFTATANTTLTLPVTGTLATLAGTETLTNKTLTAPVIATIVNTGTLTLPTSTDTLVGRATTDTLTNKTITGAVITTGSINNTPIGATTTNTGAFTTLNASNTITAQGNITGAGAATSTLDGFNIDGGTY